MSLSTCSYNHGIGNAGFSNLKHFGLQNALGAISGELGIVVGTGCLRR